MEQGLREKVGQLFMVGFDALQADEHIKTLIREKKVGGVILFRRNVHTPAQVSALCRELQEINAEVSDTPLLISIDQEGGMVMRIEQGVTPIPAAMAFQATGSIEDCERMNQISGDEMRQVGINMLLAPVLDVNNNRNNPVIGVRAYGEDAATVIDYGMAAMRGQRASGVAVTAKHFPGHGDTAIDTHYAMALVPHDKERLRAVELAPFRAAIAGGVDAIMTAHVVFPAFEADTSVPATLSKGVLTGPAARRVEIPGRRHHRLPGNGGDCRRHRHRPGRHRHLAGWRRHRPHLAPRSAADGRHRRRHRRSGARRHCHRPHRRGLRARG